MGLYQKTKVGPYIRTKTEIVDDQETKRTCSNQGCKRYHQEVYDRQTDFCSGCGYPIQERQVPKKCLAVKHQEVRDLLDDSLVPPSGEGFYEKAKNGLVIWQGNRRVPGLDRDIEPAEATETQVTPELIIHEIEVFSNFYEKELTILRQEYGDENVEVVWGVLNYVS